MAECITDVILVFIEELLVNSKHDETIRALKRSGQVVIYKVYFLTIKVLHL